MKPIIKLAYHSMWPNFNPGVMPQDYFFEFVLSQHYQVQYVDQNPDILIYSVFGPPPSRDQIAANTLTISYSGEPYDAQGDSDLAFGFHFHNQPNYIRLPIWALWIHWDNQSWPYKLTEIANAGQGSHHVATSQQFANNSQHPMRMSNIMKRHMSVNHADKFCNFTYTRHSRERVEFFLLLNQKKKIHSTGRLFNNTGYFLGSKPHELHDWRFTLAFENTQQTGYVTEKLIEPLAAGSIPIYWGGSQAVHDFNPRSFINVNDFASYQQAIDWILHVDATPSLQMQYLSEPVFTQVPEWPQLVFQEIYHRLKIKNPHMELFAT